MLHHSVKGLRKHGLWALQGSLNEIDPPAEIPEGDVLESMNWRPHQDGRSRTKRMGYAKYATAGGEVVRGLSVRKSQAGEDLVYCFDDKSITHINGPITNLYQQERPVGHPIQHGVYEEREIVFGYDQNLILEEGTCGAYVLGIEPPTHASTAEAGSSGGLSGAYKVVVTFHRKGDYPAESNPSPESNSITLSSQRLKITNIPISLDPKVNCRRIYRTTANGAIYFWLFDIDDNSTTTYEEDIPDSGLGDEANYDNFVPLVGEHFEIWDGKLWIAGIDAYPDMAIYMKPGEIEQWPSSFLQFRGSGSGRIMGIKSFLDKLHVFKEKNWFVVEKAGTNLYQITEKSLEVGLKSPASLKVCGNVMIWLSEAGLEVYNGFQSLMPNPTNLIPRTMATLNNSQLGKACAGHNKTDYEYHLSVPTGTEVEPNEVILYNYMTNKVNVLSFAEKITAFSQIEYMGSTLPSLIGTSNGNIHTKDSGWTDDKTLVSANFKIGWFSASGEGEIWAILRRMFIKYILPQYGEPADEEADIYADAGGAFELDAYGDCMPVVTTFTDAIYEADGNGDISPKGATAIPNSITLKIYRNFRKTAFASLSLEGVTPTTIIETRNEILKRCNLGVRGYYFALEFINNQNTAGECRVIGLNSYFKSRAWKKTSKAD